MSIRCELECSGELHILELTEDGELIVHDHELEAEQIAVQLGAEKSKCVYALAMFKREPTAFITHVGCIPNLRISGMIACLWIEQIIDLVDVAPKRVPGQYEFEKSKMRMVLPWARKYWRKILIKRGSTGELRDFPTIINSLKRDVFRELTTLPEILPGKAGLSEWTEEQARYCAARHALNALYVMLSIIDKNINGDPVEFKEFDEVAFFARSARCARQRTIDRKLIDQLRREQVGSAVRLWERLKRKGW